MMNIIENKLVCKYFSDENLGNSLGAVALRILNAIQTPISCGDRGLRILNFNESIVEECAISDYSGFHPFFLRLPERFQETDKVPTALFVCHECQRPFLKNKECSDAKSGPVLRDTKIGQLCGHDCCVGFDECLELKLNNKSPKVENVIVVEKIEQIILMRGWTIPQIREELYRLVMLARKS